MSSLLEIEQAAEVLPVEQKKELVAFLLTRLRASDDDLPPVRDIPKETIEGGGWRRGRLQAVPRGIVRNFLDTSVLLAVPKREHHGRSLKWHPIKAGN
ncbi:MAG: hypothetical protein CAK90_02415 [Spartobacteria bacterium AMD-G4]|nr:MAG: hypothetical protein CAK90_02415 [Spartobacteria bacterium AMD-G4]